MNEKKYEMLEDDTLNFEEENMNENKAAFTAELGALLAKYSCKDIAGLTYEKDDDGFEAVTIRFGNGYEKTVNVTCDSVIAIMQDVYKALAR